MRSLVPAQKEEEHVEPLEVNRGQLVSLVEGVPSRHRPHAGPSFLHPNQWELVSDDTDDEDDEGEMKTALCNIAHSLTAGNKVPQKTTKPS